MGVLSVDGTQLLLDGKPYYYQGTSAFNTLHNPGYLSVMIGYPGSPRLFLEGNMLGRIDIRLLQC